ncbi:Na-translocating system protein MpsC family protein [Dethiothermospora halolimnae]|uniref:Na-translocating system protein MpsC family protein n=1 Tax=Dethiothermospora halolimnae TaxID=3114390 RepID=UPI003CCC3BEB
MDDNNNLLYNLKVLLVEDEDSAREELARFIKRRVGKLYTAKNGKEGFEEFSKYKPDIVITDLKMPIMDGLEMIKLIRDKGYDCSIIILSALSDSETILKAVDIGIVKYVVKPINTEELIENIEAIASDILKNKLNESVVNNSMLLDKGEKNKLEQNIKGQVAHFIKEYSGKGPRNIRAFIQGNNIEIKAEGVLTLFEKSIISNKKNNTLVEYNRELFYKENKRDLEEKIEKVINSKVSLIDVESNSLKDKDNLTLSFL